MLLVLLLFQAARYLIFSLPPASANRPFYPDTGALIWADSIRGIAPSNPYTYTYDPNTLGDYQGYMLGLHPEEIDRLILYRLKGGIINRSQDFQRITGISDSMMRKMAPRLHFETATPLRKKDKTEKKNLSRWVVGDLNRVTADELKSIRGIGPVLSERILKFRNYLKGFLVNTQLYHVYGLDSAVADRILERYQVLEPPQVTKININRAEAGELGQLVYLNWRLARKIVAYRKRHGPFENLDELTKIEDFPKDKIDQIKLYLSL